MGSARSRQGKKDLKLCEHIVETLSGDGPQRVVLIGKTGIGKTHLARKVGEHATKKGVCYLALWLNLNNRFEDESSLYENIAFQIEAYDRDEEGEMSEYGLLKDLKEKISTELGRKKRSAEEKLKNSLTEKSTLKLAEVEKKHTALVPYLLLILDDEGNMTREDKVMKDLGLGSFLEHELNLKILITRREGDGNTTECDDETQPGDIDMSKDIESEDGEIVPHDTRCEEGIAIVLHEGIETDVDTKCNEEIVFHTTDESQALHDTLTKDDHLQDLFESLITDEAKHLLESLHKDCKIDEPLASCVVRKSMSLPAAIVVFAKSLNYITKTFKSFSPKVKDVLKQVLFPSETAYTNSASDSILHLAYALLETDTSSKSAIVDCFWHSLDFFKYVGCVHYAELITQWILEGYFDPVRSVKKAYKDGHDILLVLINRGILKIQEGDMIVPEMAMDNLIDLRHHGLLGRSRVRLSRAYGYVKNKGLGKITQTDDMIKTVHSDRVCTLLVSGNRLRREVSYKFFKQMVDLEVVCLFNPTVDPLIPVLTYLERLRVLVIRDCDLLSDIEEVKALRLLEVLEVSGASSVKVIPDGLFLEMPKLQSLNLSGLGIINSPASISELLELHTLILRDCPLLEDLPDIQNLKKLEVVDVRGARMLGTCFGVEGSRNRTFIHLQKLQLLDFSGSKIRRLPVFHNGDQVCAKLNNNSLKRLSLHSCSSLTRLPNLKPLAGLQILDLSGTTSLVEITEACFEQKKELKILKVSGTKISKLPSTICALSNLSQLLLRDNSDLEALPNIQGLTSLEIFDVSGCTKLHTVEGSFADMSYLREVNLSGTRIETVPEFPEKSSICCLKLVVLPDSKRVKHDTWSQVKKAVTSGMSESLSSSDIIQEISKNEPGQKVDLLWAFDCPKEKGGRSREHFHQGQIYRDVYMSTIPFVDTKNCQEVLEIQGVNVVDEDKETLSKVKFVAFVNNSAASLTSIFNHLKSVKGCWLEMCCDIEILFSGVDEERFENLKSLSITNLGRLESICSSSFKNLKQLSLDCCPRIKTLFPYPPSSLEVLKIKFCEKLEIVFEEEAELPNLHTLCLFELPVLSTIGVKLPNLVIYQYGNCPQLKISKENLKGF